MKNCNLIIRQNIKPEDIKNNQKQYLSKAIQKEEERANKINQHENFVLASCTSMTGNIKFHTRFTTGSLSKDFRLADKLRGQLNYMNRLRDEEKKLSIKRKEERDMIRRLENCKDKNR